MPAEDGLRNCVLVVDAGASGTGRAWAPGHVVAEDGATDYPEASEAGNAGHGQGTATEDLPVAVPTQEPSGPT
jgi:hypothetical protein